MKYIILLLSLILISGCQKPEVDPYACYTTLGPGLPGFKQILVIGDSISIGYTPYLQPQLHDNYQVTHNPCNGMQSFHVVQNLQDWLSARQWDVVVFNASLWDIADWVNTDPDTYRFNMTFIARTIKYSVPKALYVLGTNVPIHTPHRDNAKEIYFNEIAKEVMQSEGIPIVDLYTFSYNHPELHSNVLYQDDPHFIDLGYQDLSSFVVEGLNLLGVY